MKTIAAVLVMAALGLSLSAAVTNVVALSESETATMARLDKERTDAMVALNKAEAALCGEEDRIKKAHGATDANLGGCKLDANGKIVFLEGDPNRWGNVIWSFTEDYKYLTRETSFYGRLRQ